MDLSVIIISWNAAHDIKPCLDSVWIATSGMDCEIIVVDNGSTDETPRLLQAYGDKIKCIYNDSNRGISRARNQALKIALGDKIWILDVDTIVNPDAVSAMYEHLDQHSETGICACRLTSENGDIQDSCRRLPHPHHKFMNLSISLLKRSRRFDALRRRMERKNLNQFYRDELQGEEAFEAEYVIGACQMFRNDVLENTGFLDENIFYGPEDADFCLRASQKGYQVMCLPQVSIIHHYNRVTTKKIFSRMSLLHIKGLLYFYSKHNILSKI